MSNTPKVSVCIPTYNRAKYLREAIESVLMQSFADFELIICDNASVDDTSEVVNSFSDVRILYHRNPENIGSANNHKLCLELAKGEYITIFHDDDIMLQDNLLKKVKFLDAHVNVGLVSSDPYTIDDFGEITGVFYTKKSCTENEETSSDSIRGGKTSFKSLFLGYNFICFSDVLCRKKCWEELGEIEEKPYGDWEMWMRVSLFYDLGYIPLPLIKYRRHSSMDTNNYLGLIEEYDAKISIVKKYASSIPIVKSLKDTFLKDIQERSINFSIDNFRKKGCSKNLLSLLLFSIKLNPIYSIYYMFKYLIRLFRFKLGLGQKFRYLKKFLGF